MTEPITPPEGYVFHNNPGGPLSWDDPSVPGSSIVWTDATDPLRVVLVHEACGCFISMANVEAHDTWHASLTS